MARPPPQETNFDLEQQDALIRSRLSLNTIVTNPDKGFCDSCLTRIPYATLIATIQCALGVVIFCGTMYRGATLAVLMFSDVFKMQLFWVDAVKMTFVIIGACMGALGLMILTVGCLATGATRHKVYRAWRSRVGGRVSCAIFMAITYILQLLWIVIFCFLVIATFLFTIFWKMCTNERVATFQDCIDFTQFYFMFPQGTKQEHMKVCGEHNVKVFCKDYTEKIEIMVILATVASVLVILSLVHYLMCLAANYAHIRDHEKFQELQDLQMLSDNDVLAGKDRF
ncbi:neuronal membrane glycoprotein M6-a isoform X1 [Tribolium castaneum]|uniref:neuronal membrane glycoprotein M6-a isoform X1 n=1 Tax=Tribolium castaneum TaxID=7070 RepID=UPI0001758111|nr:PREDICTED: neuronal membrane glycoprotein M6-a isoform X1 [Tribolium castaneum]|eukprot:XP_015834396.1 PREDICTED: neuronal membrane glycoprotein M6-a isoform X1 [Tribolium castaneum]